jgi:hypothetical protein
MWNRTKDITVRWPVQYVTDSSYRSFGRYRWMESDPKAAVPGETARPEPLAQPDETR